MPTLSHLGFAFFLRLSMSLIRYKVYFIYDSFVPTLYHFGFLFFLRPSLSLIRL